MKREMSVFLLGVMVLLAIPAGAMVEVEGDPKARPVVCDNNGEVCTTPLIAGQTMIVGEVSIERIDGQIVVSYEINDSAWSITEVHFQVSSTPITQYAPGQYYYSFEGLNTQFHQFVATGHSPTDCYFAAHAVITDVVGYEPGPVNLPWFAYNLPDQVKMKVTQPSGRESYFTTQVYEGGILDGFYDGWCIDVGHTISTNTEYTANVYSSYESIPENANIDKPENLPLVSYIMNNYSAGDLSSSGEAFTPCDIQRAIWALIDDSETGCGSTSETRVTEIVNDALTSGPGFEPDCGEVMAVILVPTDPTRQVTIAQVTVIDVLVECGEIPILGNGSETAWGCGTPIRDKKNWGWYFRCCAPPM